MSRLGRPPLSEDSPSVHLGLSVPQDVLERINTEALKRGLSRSQWVRDALQAALPEPWQPESVEQSLARWDRHQHSELEAARQGTFVVAGVCRCGGMDCKQPRCAGEQDALSSDTSAPVGSCYFTEGGE